MTKTQTEKFKLGKQAQEAWDKLQETLDGKRGGREQKTELALKAMAQAFDRNEVYKRHYRTTKTNLKGIVYRALPYVRPRGEKAMTPRQLRLNVRGMVTQYLQDNTEYTDRYIIETMSRVFREIDLVENPELVLSRKPSPKENKAAKSLLATVRKTYKGMSLEELAKLLRATSTLAAKTAKEEEALKQSKVVATTKKAA
jgi:hypothetical protein|tara:strand:- start:1830 stop:2426 length:597 start_codon:yes stop_codon:yes gene_type:complete